MWYTTDVGENKVPVLDATPRWRRITYRAPGGRQSFEGRVTFDGKVIRGEAKQDVGPADETNYALHLLYADPADVVKVEGQSPRYATWVTLPWPATDFIWSEIPGGPHA